MRPGDLVRLRDAHWTHLTTGIVIKVHAWSDPGASDRNVGIDIYVRWSDGKTRIHDEVDLEIISEKSS